MNIKMRVAIFAGIVALASGIVFAIKYDEWVKTPQVIKAKRGYAVQQQRDPDSVRFRAELLTGEGWLCGEMNGKNAYGAYVGFKQFMSRGHDDAWIEGAGYAGKPEARSTEQIIEGLDERIAALKAINAAREKTPDLEPLAKEAMDALVEQELFKRRWQKHCA